MKQRIILWLLAALAASAAAQDIYKTVDEHGNVIYTDVPPSPDAEPMDLPPISVADPYQLPSPKDEAVSDQPADEAYGDFVWVSPSQDENFWGTAGTVAAQLRVDGQLIGGDQVKFYLDDKLVATSDSLSYRITDVFRGSHSLRAEIVGPNGQVRARSGTVTFHMHQPSVANPGAAAAAQAPRLVPDRV